MAFNPFAGFAKYKRFWMATTLILVMITFVLCSGQRGDMSDRVLQWFRLGGTPVASIDGSTYYRQDFDMIRMQRKVANEYMRRYAQLIIDTINERLRNFEPKDKDEGAMQAFNELSRIRLILSERLKKPRFFEIYTDKADSGVKDPLKAREVGASSKELIDFRVWLAEADRLGVYLAPEYRNLLIHEDIYKYPVARALGIGQEGADQLETRVWVDVRESHGRDLITIDFIRQALENEYRVRIAQLSGAKYQIRTVEPRLPKGIDMGGILAEEIRMPISPNQLWDFFQENRKEFDVALMPIPVAEFAKEIDNPDQGKLQDLFEKFKKTPFDPASDTPGFRKPHQIRVQYVSADYKSPFYQRIARVSDELSSFPIGSFAPQMPLATALRFASAPLVTPGALQLMYDDPFQFEFSKPYHAGANFITGDIASPMAAWLAREEPLAVASYVGSVLRPDNILAATPAYLAVGVWKHPDELKAGIEMEARRRVPLYATLIATGTMPTGLAVGGEIVTLADERPRFANAWPMLPLPIVQKSLLDRYDQRLASRYVIANMSFLKKKLEEENVVGKASQVNRLLERYGPLKPGTPAPEGYIRDLGLEIAQTEKHHDRYTIKDAPELKPLLESFERYYTTVNQTEGRESRPESALKEDDVWKLFFDGTESFSVATGKYNARPWPPVVRLGTRDQLQSMVQRATQRLEFNRETLDEMLRLANSREGNKEVTFNLFGTSNRPFLFWKTDEKPSEIPDKLADVQDRVLEAWKAQQAREGKVLPYVRTLAEGLLKANADYASVLKLDSKFGKDIISLPRLAPIYHERQHFGGPGIYTDYKIPRGLINYPRDDMVSQLLSLNDPEKLPIKIGVADIDKLNTDLFEMAKNSKLDSDKYIQVLTNKPRDTFYVAVIQLSRGAQALEFYLSVLPGAAREQDLLFERAQQKLGAEHFRELTVQLRKDHRVNVLEGAASYDGEGARE